MRRRTIGKVGTHGVRGAVLVMVLMVTMVVALISLQIALNAKEHVRRSQVLRDRAEATLQMRSIESRLQFEMLTNNWVLITERDGTPSWRGLNVVGRPFDELGVSVVLQDLSGFFAMPQPGRTGPDLALLFRDVGIDPLKADKAAERLLEWQRKADGAPLQDLADLIPQTGLDIQDVEKLRQVATVYPLTAFNPLTAPLVVLNRVYSGLDLDNLVRLSQANALTRMSVVKAVPSIDEEFTVFSPGPAFRFDMESTFGSAAVGREAVFVFDPYANEPVTIWSVRRKSFLTRAKP